MPEAGTPTLYDRTDRPGRPDPEPADPVSAAPPVYAADDALEEVRGDHEPLLPHRPPVPAIPPGSPTFTAPEPKRHSLCLRADEPLSFALRRVALDQFAVAIDGLADLGDDRDTVVHEARKALKRLRGMLRLVRDEIGYEVYRNENVVLRDVGRQLAPVRDSWVMATTVRHLEEAAPVALPAGTYTALHDRLMLRHLQVTDETLADRQRMLDVGTTLRTARARFASWPVADAVVETGEAPVRHRIPDAFSAMDRGIERVYRRGRRAMRAAYRTPAELTFHEWRKRVKYLRYQVEALNLLWPNMLGTLEASLGELADVLGDEHDLAVLGVMVTSDRQLLPVDTERYSFLTAVARQRMAQQRRAFGIGLRAYAEAPPAFVARMRAYWRTAVLPPRR